MDAVDLTVLVNILNIFLLQCVPEVDPATNKPIPPSLQKNISTMSFPSAPNTLTGYSVPQSLSSSPITVNVEQVQKPVQRVNNIFCVVFWAPIGYIVLTLW